MVPRLALPVPPDTSHSIHRCLDLDADAQWIWLSWCRHWQWWIHQRRKIDGQRLARGCGKIMREIWSWKRWIDIKHSLKHINPQCVKIPNTQKVFEHGVRQHALSHVAQQFHSRAGRATEHSFGSRPGSGKGLGWFNMQLSLWLICKRWIVALSSFGILPFLVHFFRSMARMSFASCNRASTRWHHLPFLGGCIHKHQPGARSHWNQYSACYAFRPVRMAIEVPNNNFSAFSGSSLVVDIKIAFEVLSVMPWCIASSIHSQHFFL